MGIEECPTCRERQSHNSGPRKSVGKPAITLPGEGPSQEQDEATSESAHTSRDPLPRIMPATCLDCGQSFIGGDECPPCAEQTRQSERARRMEPEILLPDEPPAEEQVIQAKVLFEEMREIGFEIT